jgi:serine/threonine-protein kinase
MGDVWRATDTVLGRGIAVKMLHARRADDPGFQSRFRHEARAMAMLHHPGVADVYDYGETTDGDGAYIVMAYIDGQPLDRRIAEAGRLDPATTMSIVAQAARALHAAHVEGIVHRDVKPGNLIIRPDGTVVLVDFGVARSASSTTLTGVDEVIGTALYIAPEQVSKRPTGPATDIYALGAVAYHCLAGHPPFLGDNPLAVAMHHLGDDPPPLPADVPAGVRELVSTAMAKDPADRFSTAAAMADAADAIATRPAPDAPAEQTVVAAVPAAAGTRRFSRRATAGALGLLAVATIGAILFLTEPGAFNPGPSNPPVPSHQPSGSAGAGQAEEPATASDPPGQPDATPATIADSPVDPARSRPAATNPPPPEDDPTGSAPSPPATEPAPTASAVEQAPPTVPAAE